MEGDRKFQPDCSAHLYSRNTGAEMPTVEQVEELLRSALEAEDVSVTDISGE